MQGLQPIECTFVGWLHHCPVYEGKAVFFVWAPSHAANAAQKKLEKKAASDYPSQPTLSQDSLCPCQFLQKKKCWSLESRHRWKNSLFSNFADETYVVM